MSASNSGTGWLSLFGRGRASVPAPSSDRAGGLPVPVTVRDLKQRARQEAKAAAERPRLVFAFDATASREPAWGAARQLQDSLLAALPGELEVALAVHAGSRVTLFSDFTSNASELRDQAAGVRCAAGITRLLDILDRAVKLKPAPSVVVYVGDVFEESRRRALRLADDLLLRGTRVIILHDTGHPGGASRRVSVLPGDDVFNELAERTGGAVLPFDITALPSLRELLQAVAVLAVGDVELLQKKQATMPAAKLLLENLGSKPPLIGSR